MATPVFRLRKATIEDFPEYYQFHLESLYHWLMFDYEEAKAELNQSQENDDDFFSLINNYYLNFNQSQFEKELEDYRIYMVVIDQKSVGYVKLENYCGKQILREWPIAFEHRSPELLAEMLVAIEKLKSPRCKAFQVIAMADSSAKFLISHGYTCRIRPFFEKTLA